MREAKTRWTCPVGIFGHHAFISFCEVEGNMPRLITTSHQSPRTYYLARLVAKSDLKSFRSGTQRQTQPTLSSSRSTTKSSSRVGGCTMLSLTDFNPETVGVGDKFKRFQPHLDNHF